MIPTTCRAARRKERCIRRARHVAGWTAASANNITRYVVYGVLKMSDVVAEMGPVFLGSRLKRLAERLQGDAARMAEAARLPVQPSQMPLLTTLDRHGPLTVGAAVEILGISQPAVTRILSRLVALGLVETSRAHRDQRQKTIALAAE
eukprot:gene4903-6668_t